MTQSMILLIVTAVVLVIFIAAINKNSIRRDKENADNLKTQLQAKDRAIAELKSSIDQINSVAAKHESTINALTDVVSSLNRENQKLRSELDAQKKKLDFYMGIDKAAEELTVDEDAKDRAALLEQVRQQVASQNSSVQHGGENKQNTGSAHPSASGLSDGETAAARILDEEQEFAVFRIINTEWY